MSLPKTITRPYLQHNTNSKEQKDLLDFIDNGAMTSLLTATHNNSTTWSYNAQTPLN